MEKRTIFINFVTDKELGRVGDLLNYREGTRVSMEFQNGISMFTVESRTPDYIDFENDMVIRKLFLIRDVPPGGN